MKKISILLILGLIFSGGCIWVDDDDDYCCYNQEEHIIYVNLTNHTIDNFIDDIFVGTVTANSELHVYGYDYDGYHIFYSRCINCNREWGPDRFGLYDGETFTIYLDETGTRFEHASNIISS